MSAGPKLRVAQVRRIESAIGRPAPAPRPHFPDLDGLTVRARCVDVSIRFNARWRREEVHLLFEVLDEGAAHGAIVWSKLNYPQEIGQGAFFYRWYCALVDVPAAGESMAPDSFRGVEARITLRTSRSTPPYTVVDVGAALSLPRFGGRLTAGESRRRCSGCGNLWAARSAFQAAVGIA